MTIFDLLSETRKQLIKEISSLTGEQFNEKPALDKWSIAQICHHLYIVEGLFTKAIKKGLKSESHDNLERKNIHIITDRMQKFKSPEIAEPSEEQFDVQTMLKLLNESRYHFLNLLHEMENHSILSKKAAKHPVFGELPLEQWIDLLYLHEQRHIEQIKYIKLSKEFKL